MSNEIKLGAKWGNPGCWLPGSMVILCSVKWESPLGCWQFDTNLINPNSKPYFLLIEHNSAYITDGCEYASISVNLTLQRIYDASLLCGDLLDKNRTMEIISSRINLLNK